MKIMSFCGMLSLQVGVLFTSAFFMTLTVCVVLANASDYTKEREFIFLGVWVTMSVILVIWSAAFLGAFFENRELILVAFSSWLMFIVFWIIFDVGCTTPNRCSEGLWLVYNEHRLEAGSGFNGPDYYYHHDHESPTDKPPKDFQDLSPNRKRPKRSTEKGFGSKFYIPWESNTGAILFIGCFIVTLCIFILAAILLHAYSLELKCLKTLVEMNC